MTPAQLSIAFFAQLTVILIACRLVGWFGRRFLGQPQVVGEMIAGVLLGPSLLGLIAPELQALLFPPETKGMLFVGAQLGVGLYMFLVGLGFDRSHFRIHGRSAAAVSISGMAAPFLTAVLITPWLMTIGGLFTPSVTRFEATLFMGAAISITAFPMLARIIHERGITNSPLGTLSLSAGAIDDAGAWTVLAIVLASFGDGPMVAVKALAGGIGFAVFMLLLGPRLFAPLGSWAEREGGVSQTLLAIVLILFMLSAFAMDVVGIHAVFGGFVLGCVLPRGRLADDVRAKLEPMTVVLLLPMFFTFSGLNTQLTMVDSLPLVAVAAAILAASILAKGGACWAAARLTGQDNPTAMAIGALMNARGLMELIIINIGLQRGIIGPALFSVLVLMAIVTTLMASPLFERVYGRRARARGDLGSLRDTGAAEPAAAERQ
jgi:Kef-type K+ transport system membrane component KefB